MKKGMALFLCYMVLLFGCMTDEGTRQIATNDAVEASTDSWEEEGEMHAQLKTLTYVQSLALECVESLGVDLSSGEEGIRVLYRYLIENVYFADPVGLDMWRYLSEEEEAIPFIENRSLSPFLFGIGSCEDFAAAMVMLLEAAGYEAEYVAGYTLSIDQVYIDHAWAVVKLDGNWYHLDPQLEQNVVRQDWLKYRFYLLSDEEMLVDHKWGDNLLDYWHDFAPEEEDMIREQYSPPVCSTVFPRIDGVEVTLPSKPDFNAVEWEIQALRKESEKLGTLPPLMLNVEPPVLSKIHHITPTLYYEGMAD